MRRILFCMFVYIESAQFTNNATGTAALTTSFDVHNEINPLITPNANESNNTVPLDEIANLAQKKGLDTIESYNLEIKKLKEVLKSKYDLYDLEEKRLEEMQSRIIYLNAKKKAKMPINERDKIDKMLETTINQKTKQNELTIAAFEEYMTALDLVNTKIEKLRSFIEKELKKLPYEPRKGEKHPKYIPRYFAAAHETVLF